MNKRHSYRDGRVTARVAMALITAALVGCGGGGGGVVNGTGTQQDSGPNKTYLTVQASDADGDALQYQWRVTAGTIENRNARETVWTMPNGPGLHFAYVTISDGRGGYVEQQYAVSTDALGTSAPVPQAVSYTAPVLTDFTGSAARLRVASPDNTLFLSPDTGATAKRTVYLPDVQVEVIQHTTGETVFSGVTDLSGEVSLPKLQNTQVYDVKCSTSQASAPVLCRDFTAGTEAIVVPVSPNLTAASNLRLFGHVSLVDGGVCGTQDEFFGIQSAAAVQLLQADGAALTAFVRVNRFGDYALDAAVPVKGSLKLRVQCESYSRTLDVPASPDVTGYVSTRPIELSHQVPNTRPRVVKMVANGPDGNVRGKMIIAEPGAMSNGLPGSAQFLTYKGKDTRLSACMYYRSLGATKDCDAQGNMIAPISFEDWKRQHQFKPYSNNPEVAANFINKMDLNLVRRMVATQAAPDNIAFYVCNHPGPEGASQAEIDQVLSTGMTDGNRVACVAMEWSKTAGVNGNLPFTKFLTFAPDGSLIASINLDKRGEKFMPGACIACHGGTQYNGRFPDKGNPSPYLGSGFLPFDTGNYLFGAGLNESEQSEAFYMLNQLARATETSDTTALSRLVQGWYADGTKTLNKNYVPVVWSDADAVPATAGAARFYREVVGSSCRTCHAALGQKFNWDAVVLKPDSNRVRAHVCGGTEDLAINASMPNARISRDHLSERVRSDPTLAALMNSFLGCDAPLPDPVYPKR